MGQALEAVDSSQSNLARPGYRQYVTMRIQGQLLGIPVLQIDDVLRPREITPVPMSPPEIAGMLNLRGRVVTAVDLRQKLGLPEHEERDKSMHVVTTYQGDLYSFLIDEVGDVLTLPAEEFESPPANLETHWKMIASGIYRLESELMVVLDVQKLLGDN